MKWTLFAEGPSDRALVEWLVRRLGITHRVEVAIIGGGVSKLKNIANEIRKCHSRGRRIAVVLDADSDARVRREQLAAEIDRLSLPDERSFLLPDDASEGDLETLLEQMAPSEHRAVHACFAEYEACLRRLDSDYSIPNRKARLYAYCETVGAETGHDKNYDDQRHWSHTAPALAPLREFLRDIVS